MARATSLYLEEVGPIPPMPTTAIRSIVRRVTDNDETVARNHHGRPDYIIWKTL